LRNYNKRADELANECVNKYCKKWYKSFIYLIY
jgi:hypothetical protein